MAVAPVLRPKGIPTIFGELEEKRITFLIDTSGSMYSYLEIVKEHLIEVLLACSFKQKSSMFNIMEFSAEVIPWADRMVKCTPQTVTVASEWVKTLGCKTGTNTLDALLAGFSDPACQAVYLVTDGLPDQMPEDILQHVAIASKGRPVHSVYLAGGIADIPACDFLSNLATETAGTFHSISLSNKGSIEKVKVIVRSDHGIIDEPTIKDWTEYTTTTLDNPPITNVKVYNTSLKGIPATSIKTSLQNLPKSNTITYAANVEGSISKTCSVVTSLDHTPPSGKLISVENIPTRIIQTESTRLQYPELSWETYRPGTTRLVHRLLATSVNEPTVTGGVLMQGMKVLARRDKDGFYCLGFVKQLITANHTFLIEFEKGLGAKGQPQLQETAIYDIISYNDASRHSIAAGDKVLALYSKTQAQFAPGTVLEGLEGRSSGCAADTDSLVISFFDGKSEKLLKQTSVWIPTQLYDRIKLEIQMPITARKYLINTPQYPIMFPPGYSSTRASMVNPYPSRSEQNLSYLLGYDTQLEPHEKHQIYIPVYPEDVGLRMPSIRGSVVQSEEMHKLIPGTNLTKEDLNRKVMQQLVDNEMIPAMLRETAEWKDEHVSSPVKGSGINQKNVSFSKENERQDSGIGSYTTDLKEESEPESEEKEYDDRFIETGAQLLSLRDDTVTDESLLYNYHLDRSVEERSPWQYWGPNTMSLKHRSSKTRPFRDTLLNAPAEAKIQPVLAKPITAMSMNRRQALLDGIDQEIKTDRAQLEWIQRHPHPPLRLPYDAEFDGGPVNRSSAFNKVDFHQVKNDQAHLEWTLKNPQPPNGSVHQQSMHVPAHRKVGSRDMVREAKEKAYMEYRRNQVLQIEAHYAELEDRASRIKDSKDEKCREKLTVSDSLIMKYDASHLEKSEDNIITEELNEANISRTDGPKTANSPQSFIQSCRRPQGKLTVRDVVFHSRKTITPPELSKQTSDKVIEPKLLHHGQIYANPLSLSRPTSTVHKEMSKLDQRSTMTGQKRSIKLCSNKVLTRDLERFFPSFLQNTVSVQYDNDDVDYSMQSTSCSTLHETLAQSGLSKTLDNSNDGISKCTSTKAGQNVIETTCRTTTTSTLHSSVNSKTITSHNRSKHKVSRRGNQDNALVTQEKSINNNSYGSTISQSQTTAVNRSQICTKIKSSDSIQMTTGIKSHTAASLSPVPPHQKFAADVTRRDVQRQQDSEEKLRHIQNAKRSVSSSIAQQQRERSDRESEKSTLRVNELRKKTQRREEIVAQREKDIQETIQRRQEIKQQRQDELTRRHAKHLDEQTNQEVARDAQRRNNEIKRREFFYNKERKNQEAKDLRLAVREQKYHDLRSQVLP